jgi:hypothetical protein
MRVFGDFSNKRHFCPGWNTKPRLGFFQRYAPQAPGQNSFRIDYCQKKTERQIQRHWIEHEKKVVLD